MTTVSGQASGARRFYANLEILRFLAAVAVMVYHYPMFANPDVVGQTQALTSTEEMPFFSVAAFGYIAGYTAVPAFWLLSGFIFFSQYRQTITSRRVSGGKFFWLRFSRLYPLYFVALLLGAIAAALFAQGNPERPFFERPDSSAPPTVWQFLREMVFFGGENPITEYAFNAPAWSLSVEVVLYLLFFVLHRYLPRFATCCAIAASVLVWFVLAKDANSWVQGFAFFFFGGAIYLASLRIGGLPLLIQRRIRMILILLFGGFGSVISVLFVMTGMGLSGKAFFFNQDPSILYLAFAALVMFLAIVPQVNGLPRRMFSSLGNLTYAIYLIHFPLLLITISVYQMAGIRVPYENPLLFVGWVTVTLLLAGCVYYCFEKPMQRWLRSRQPAAIR
jgi:peptidoglycan/LPS O-acetylase OafA/YrhL